MNPEKRVAGSGRKHLNDATESFMESNGSRHQ